MEFAELETVGLEGAVGAEEYQGEGAQMEFVEVEALTLEYLEKATNFWHHLNPSFPCYHLHPQIFHSLHFLPGMLVFRQVDDSVQPSPCSTATARI